MKFLADMNVSRKVVESLRSAGLDVVRVGDVLDQRAPDAEILAEAERLGAIILSHDQDFSTLLANSGARQPSLINLRVSYVDSERLARLILLSTYTTTSWRSSGATSWGRPSRSPPDATRSAPPPPSRRARRFYRCVSLVESPADDQLARAPRRLA